MKPRMDYSKVYRQKLKFLLARCQWLWYTIGVVKSGCGAVGSALDWGSRGREFKSRHSDHYE